MKHNHLSPVLVILSFVLAAGVTASAQGPGTPPPGDRFAFEGMEMSLGGHLVKGAPYSAQTTTQITQTLGDGNHINRTITAQVYRDSQGRTRHEHSVSAIGPWVAEGKAKQMVLINDPVAGVHYVLDAGQKTAVKMTLPAGWPGGHFGANRPWRGNLDGQLSPDSQVVKEDLGKRTIEGVETEGTRVTFTIPAGKVGNERQLQIVSERWYSADLQMVILSKRSDPRMGDSVYRVTNIVRTEPDSSLFAVPADYTVTEGKAGMGPGRMGRRMRPL
jgi:hypothetical protein